MSLLEILGASVFGYIVGSLPFAVWIARAHQVDIFSAGSGNPGATNVKRVVGRGAGNLCFALDAIKGAVAALVPIALSSGGDSAYLCGVIGLLAAIVVHSFSVFIRFRGGKGVATTVGGMFALSPVVMFSGALVWVVVFYATGYVSVASIALGLTLPLASIAFGLPVGLTLLSLALFALILFRHRANLRRLREGLEHCYRK